MIKSKEAFMLHREEWQRKEEIEQLKARMDFTCKLNQAKRKKQCNPKS